MVVYRENEADIINPDTQMHYALLSGYQKTVYPQSHDFFELVLPISGRQELWIDGTHMTAGPGMLVLIRPGEVHTRRYVQPGWHINVAFSSEIASKMFDYLGPGFPSEGLLSAPPPVCALLPAARAQSYRERFDQLNLIPVEQAARSRAVLRALLMEIFTRELMQPGTASKVGGDWFACLLEQARTPEAVSQGVDGLVRLCGKSHEHLCRVFRQRLGMTPTAYVNDLRLTYAANRLLHSCDSITDVCFSSGFDSLSHFYHLFRGKYGQTPQEFRIVKEEFSCK